MRYASARAWRRRRFGSTQGAFRSGRRSSNPQHAYRFGDAALPGGDQPARVESDRRVTETFGSVAHRCRRRCAFHGVAKIGRHLHDLEDPPSATVPAAVARGTTRGFGYGAAGRDAERLGGNTGDASRLQRSQSRRTSRCETIAVTEPPRRVEKGRVLPSVRARRARRCCVTS